MAPTPAWAVVGLLGALAAGRLGDWWMPLVPICLWRHWTGVPCPLCGGTRALTALAHGHWERACALNPLAVLAGGMILLWFLAWTAERWMQVPSSQAWGRLARSRLGRGLAAGLVALNWLYLCATLPR